MAGNNADLVVRVAANISALQADMATAAASIKTIEGAVTSAGVATGGFVGWLESLGHSFVAHVAEGVLLRDVIREIINIGKEAFADAGRFEDLARATGLSIQAIQQFSYVGVEFGISSEEMARGVEQLSAKLANGDKSAVGAVQLLGLSFTDLLAAGPEEMFLRVTDALGRIEDPMTKGGLAAELFGGKLAKILLPMLGELREKLDDAGHSAAMMSDDTVKAAHKFEIGWERALMVTKAFVAEGAIALWNALARGNQAIADQSLAEQGLTESTEALTAATKAFVGPVQEQITKAQILTNWLNQLRAEGLEKLTDAQKDAILTAEAHGRSLSEIATRLGVSEAAVKLFTTANKEAAAAQKLFAAATENVNAVGTTWQETLADMEPGLVADAKAMLAAGASARDLEIAWGILPSKMKAIEISAKADAEALKDLAAQEAQLRIVTDEYYKSLAAASHDSVGVQITDAYLAADAKIAAMTKAKSYSVEAEMMIWRAADQTATNIMRKNLESDVNSHAHFEKLADEAEIAYQRAAGSAGEYSDAVIQKMRDTAEAARMAANTFGTELTVAVGKLPPALDKVSTSFKGLNVQIAASVEQMRAWSAATAHNANTGQMNGSSNVTGIGSTVGSLSFASGSGGFQDFGSGTPAILHGREAVVREGDGLGGGTTVINNYITQPLGTPDAIARAVDQALMARQRNGGLRLPSGA